MENNEFNGEEYNSILSGKALLNREQEVEDAITALIEYLFYSNQMGVYSPLIYEQLGNSLSLIVQMASCAWGCRGGEHDIENILRRFCNSAFAALRLMNSGLYDEALNHARSMGEIANLLQVFCLSEGNLEEWKKLSAKGRMRKFSPAKVRSFIESQGQQPVVDQATYSKLCEISVHISPSSLYLSHEFNGIHHIGGHFALQGIFLVLNTISRFVACCIIFAGVLTKVSEEKMYLLKKAFDDLNKVIRGISVINYEEFFTKQQADRVHESLDREISENFEKIQELGKDVYQGITIDDKLDEEQIKKIVVDRTMNKVLEQVRRQIQEKDLQWVDEGTRFATQWLFERKLKQYNRWKQASDNQMDNQPPG